MQETYEIKKYSEVRLSDRSAYDKETIYKIIDANPIGHVGFLDAGTVMVIPMNVWRMKNKLYLHCLKGGRLDKVLPANERCSISFAEHNAWVLSKSAYHTSANYRSVVAYGKFLAVNDKQEFMASFETFLNQIESGRWNKVRPLSEKEIKATSLLSFTIETASAKSRTGPAKEEPSDLAWDVQAGIIPLNKMRGELQDIY